MKTSIKVSLKILSLGVKLYKPASRVARLKRSQLTPIKINNSSIEISIITQPQILATATAANLPWPFNYFSAHFDTWMRVAMYYFTVSSLGQFYRIMKKCQTYISI